MAHVDVYGHPHSPWVQAVLLGLHDRRISYSLRSVPPLSVFARSGVMMPAASVNGDKWQLESGDILQRVGYAALESRDQRALRAAWQGVLHRADSASGFFGGFSRTGDLSASSLIRIRNNFLRNFVTLYFFLVIRFAVFSRTVQDPVEFGDQFLHWEQALIASKTDFLDGEVPGTRDMMLFGIVQCHCSIPVAPVAALQKDERLSHLRTWIGLMQTRFADYPYLYSGPHFEPFQAAPQPARTLDRLAFWAGTVVMLISFPVTLPLIALLASNVRRPR